MDKQSEIVTYLKSLQREHILPAGDFSLKCWDQQASNLCQVNLKNGYFVKSIKARHGGMLDSKNEIQKSYHHELRALQLLTPFFEKKDNFNIPELVHHNTHTLTLLTKALSGERLQELCNRYAQRFGGEENNAEQACQNIGEFLKFLHSIERVDYSIESLNALLAYIRERIPADCFSVVQLTSIDTWLKSMEKHISADLNSYNKVFVHHDLNPTNILVEGNTIGVLDFADFSRESPYQDLVYFPLMLQGQLENRIKYLPEKKSKLLSCFYTGYGCDYTEMRQDPLYLLYIMKNLLIFMVTYKHILQDKSYKFSLSAVKSRIIFRFDFLQIRKKIIRMVS